MIEVIGFEEMVCEMGGKNLLKKFGSGGVCCIFVWRYEGRRGKERIVKVN